MLKTETDLDQQLSQLKSVQKSDTRELEARILAKAEFQEPVTLKTRSSRRWQLVAPFMAGLMLAGMYFMMPTNKPIQVSDKELALAQLEFDELWLMQDQLLLDEF